MAWNTPDDVSECKVCGELYFGSFCDVCDEHRQEKEDEQDEYDSDYEEDY